jgi:beta-N-acetylhexosaminidase
MGINPTRVGLLGVSYMRGLYAAGIIPVVKHFPGHGCAAGDTHSELPVVPAHKHREVESGLIPFRHAVESGVEAIMTAHVVYEYLDSKFPATLSQKIIRGLLRGTLEYEGMVISDALEMAALRANFKLRDTLRLCIKAGIDLILVSGTYEIVRLKQAVLSLLNDDAITEQEIDEGLRRILELKLKHGLIAQTSNTP